MAQQTGTAAAEVDAGDSDRPTGSSRRRVANPSVSAGTRTRTVPMVLGEYEYTTRVPKLIVWQNMAETLRDQAVRPAKNRRDRRRAGQRGAAASPTASIDNIRLTSALTVFLRGCVSEDDWADIEGDLGDPDSDVDVPDLWAAGLSLVVEFYPDMRRMADQIGMKVPGVLGGLVEQAKQFAADDGEPDDGGGDQADDDEPEAPAPAPRKAARKAAGRKATGKAAAQR